MRFSRYAIAVVLSIVAAGCSSGSDDAAPDETSTTAPITVETDSNADGSSSVESGDGADGAGDRQINSLAQAGVE